MRDTLGSGDETTSGKDTYLCIKGTFCDASAYKMTIYFYL